MRYYIADLHYFHESINTKMDNRGFKNVYDMNEYMISQWNKRVKNNDEVVILGDFSVGKADETSEILKRLKGDKYLIIGNHDKFLKDKTFDKNLFKNINGYNELNDNKQKIILSHYPIICYNGQYRLDENKNPKTIMLHGHVHDTYDQTLLDQFIKITNKTQRTIRNEKIFIPCNILNCFCKWSNYVPWTLEEWIYFHNKRIETGFPILQSAF